VERKTVSKKKMERKRDTKGQTNTYLFWLFWVSKWPPPPWRSRLYNFMWKYGI